MTDHPAARVPDNAGLILPPPLFLAIALAGAIALDFLIPIAFVPLWHVASLSAGVVLIALALGLAFWGEHTFKRHNTDVRPWKPTSRIVETGPFAYVRNPIYVGFVLVLIGVGFAAALEWALILAPVLWIALHFLVVRREEDYLTRKFGGVYTAYLTKVRRWGLF